MAREFVLLGDVAPSTDQWRDAVTAVLGGANLLEFRAGLQHVTRVDGRPVVSWWPPRPMDNPREAIAELGERASGVAVWVDVVLPELDDIGLQVIGLIARRHGLQVVERGDNDAS